jgi:hypothetical protein
MSSFISLLYSESARIFYSSGRIVVFKDDVDAEYDMLMGEMNSDENAPTIH